MFSVAQTGNVTYFNFNFFFKGKFTVEKIIYRDEGLKHTVISFEKNRVHYGIPYNGIYMHPPYFVSGYDVATKW